MSAMKEIMFAVSLTVSPWAICDFPSSRSCTSSPRRLHAEAKENLVLVELICHGIPSDHMLQTYIGMQERKYGARLTRMEFRNKKKGWHNSSVRMEFANVEV